MGKVRSDGRVARRERNQHMVLDAVVDLFDRDGQTTGVGPRKPPAVEEVAASSGVSTRSIYRYFHHRDGLIEAAMWHLVDRINLDRPLELGNGPLPNRLSACVEHRLHVYRRVAPLVWALQQTPASVDPAARSTPPGGRPGSTIDVDRSWNLADEHHPDGVLGRRLSEVFASEFAALADDERRQSEAIVDMASQFASFDFLAAYFHGDHDAVAATLLRLFRQQMPVASSTDAA